MPYRNNKWERTKKLRGLSKQKTCLYTAVDEGGNFFAKVSCENGKPSLLSTDTALADLIKSSSIECAITDGEASYKNLFKYRQIEHRVIDSKKMAKLNNIHEKMKAWCAKFVSISKKYMQLFINLFWFKYDDYYGCAVSKWKTFVQLFYRKVIYNIWL
jgi:IS1 family transposase